MADITEVIHKIVYEVDDAALQNVQRLIQLQIQEFNILSKSLLDIQKQIERTGNAETAKLDELSKKLDAVTAKITVGAAKTKGLMEQVGNGLLKAAGAGDGLEGIIANFLEPFIAGIPELLEGTITVGALTTEVLSFSNVVTASIAVLAMLIDYFANADKEAEELTDEMKAANEILKDYAHTASSEIGQFSTLYNVITDANTSLEQKKSAMNELRELYPEYLGQLKDEEFYTDKATIAYGKLIDAIYKRARAKAYQKRYDTLVEEEITLNEQIGELKKKYKDPGPKYKYMKVGDKWVLVEQFYIDNSSSGIESMQAHEDVKKLDERLGEVKREQADIGQKITENYVPVAPPRSNYIGTHTGTASTRRKLPKEKQVTPLQPSHGLLSLPVNIEQPVFQTVDADAILKEAQEKQRLEQEAKDKAAQERRREQIKKSIDAYKQLADAATQAFQTIYEAQIKALDKEIAIRQKRVDEAMKLAERGNTEVLRQEEERLKETQKKREQYARREQVVNAAVTISNAIVAIAKAAAEGAGQGGYGAIATVAATIAALAAGYAAVQSLSNNSESIKDGVVDYRGAGGPRDDANWVRISSGESVITAGGTKANRHLLEAINNGTQFRVLDPALAYTMPAFRQPQQLQQGAYASAQDMQTLERKLDDVVSAIEDNRMKQDIFFNEHGVGLLTERAIRKNNRRFR